jgi:hypothetical protein
MDSAVRVHFEEYRTEFAADSVVGALAARGLSTFDGCPKRQDLMSIVESLGKVHLHRDSDPQGLTILEPKAGLPSSYAGFTRKGLFPHTDVSGELHPPDVMVFYCEQQAEFGGESLLVDGRELFLELLQRDHLLSILTRPDAAMFRSESGFVPMPILAQNQFGRFAFRFRRDEFSLFSEHLAYRLPELIELIRRHMLSLRLRSGEGLILNNGWWLHGRSAFRGYRRAVRILVDVEPRLDPSRLKLLRGFAA